MSVGSAICRFVLVGILLLEAIPAVAASVLSVGPSGNGTFVLRGSGLVDAAIIDVEITYDSTSLANPRVTQGAFVTGAMTAANVDVPGVVRLSIIPAQSIGGNGTIATIVFSRTGEAPGKINGLNGRITTKAGKSLPLSFGVENPPDNASGRIAEENGQSPTQSPTKETNPPAPPATGGDGAQYPFVVGGNLTLPNDDTVVKTQKPQEQPEPAQEAQDVVATPASEAPLMDRAKVDPPKAAVETASQEHVVSVLERFRLFQGSRTVAALTGLFESSKSSRYQQYPAVIIADGKNTAKVSIQKIAGTHAPNFAFTSAQAVSWDISGDVWLVETKPAAGVVNSSVSVLMDGVVYTFPLVVSPIVNVDLDRSGTVTEDDFRLFLKERGTASAPKFDLNGDGKHDYVDDYIFTANYLARKFGAPQKKVTEGNPLKVRQ